MGLFDIVIVDPPFLCERCGATLEIQTKEFDPGMSTYRIGSVLSSSPVVVGVVKDSLFCSACHSAGRTASDPLFFVIWHHILAGVERTEEAALARLASVDRLDLIAWLDQAQRGEREWRQRHRRFYRDVELWHEHVERENAQHAAGSAAGATDSESEASTRVPFRFLQLSDEILNSPDPLAEILSQHEEHSPEADGLF